jgi:hypothetical protein
MPVGGGEAGCLRSEAGGLRDLNEDLPPVRNSSDRRLMIRRKSYFFLFFLPFFDAF